MTFNHMNVNKAYTEIVAGLKKELTFICEGTSMNPVLKNGDEVLVSRVPLFSLRFGDIITYKSDDMFITHRFFYSKHMQNVEIIIAKADNRLKLDKPVSASSLIGKVTKISRDGKTIEMQKTIWYCVSYFITVLSLIEGHFFAILLSMKRIICRNSDISPRMKQRLNDNLQKPKRWILHASSLILGR